MKRSAFEFELAAARNCEQGYCRAAHKWASQNHRTNETQRDMVGVIAYYIRHCCDYKQWVINLHFAYGRFAYGRRANQQPRAFRAFCRSPWWGYPQGFPKRRCVLGLSGVENVSIAAWQRRRTVGYCGMVLFLMTIRWPWDAMWRTRRKGVPLSRNGV